MPPRIVRADYEQLQTIASRFASEAEHAHATRARLKNQTNTLRGGDWLGRGANAFYAEMDTTIFPTLQRWETALREAERTTRLISAIMRQAEDDAARVFQSTGAGGAPTPPLPITPSQPPTSPNKLGATLLNQLGQWAGQVQKGIEGLFQVGLHMGGMAAKAFGNLLQAALQESDRAFKQLLDFFLPNVRPGSTESLEFELKGDATIPFVGVSPKAKATQSGKITRNPDGTYTLTLKTELGAGAEFDLIEGELAVKLGKTKLGLGGKAGVEAMEKKAIEMAFKFDPNTPGDMTKMAAFMTALTGSTLNPSLTPLVSPTLSELSNNFESVKVSKGLEGQLNLDLTLVKKVAGLELTGELASGGKLSKNDQGHWQVTTFAELGGGGTGQLGSKELGFELNQSLSAKGTVETTTDLSTRQIASTKVSVEFETTNGAPLSFQDIKAALPGAKNLHLSANTYGKITVEYELHAPVEAAQNFIKGRDGWPDWQAISRHSEISVKAAMRDETGLGAKGNVAISGTSIGLNVEGNIKRESEVEVAKIKGAAVQ